MCVCVRVCVRACVCVYVLVCVCTYVGEYLTSGRLCPCGVTQLLSLTTLQYNAIMNIIFSSYTK